MLRRLLRSVRGSQPSDLPAINLVSEADAVMPTSIPSIGITTTPPAVAWTVARLEQIFHRCNSDPSDQDAQMQARHARHCLSSFWLMAPIDQLEILYQGPIGHAYRELLLGRLPALPLAPDEASWKEALARRLQDNFETSHRPNLLLAVMPYCAPGRMSLESPLTSLPPWLLADYGRCFDPDLLNRSGRPPASLPSQVSTPQLSQLQRSPTATGVAAAPSESASPSVAPSATLPPLPRLCDMPGVEAFRLFQDDEFRERMLGLINLFRIDPLDQEVLGELLRLRRLISQVWLDVTPASLEPLYRSPMGALFRALLASDFGALPDQGEELALRQALTQVAINQDHPAMVQALLAVMPFYPQGRMRLGSGQDRLPPWLRDAFAGLAGLQSGS